MNEQISDVDRLVKTFISTLAIIITIGLIMVWSASFILAAEKFGSSLHYITRRLINLAFRYGGLYCFLVQNIHSGLSMDIGSTLLHL